MDGSSHTLNIEGPGKFDISTYYCPAIEGAKDEGSGVVLQTPYYVVFSNVTAELSSTENDMRRLASCTFKSNSHVTLKATNNTDYSTVSDVGIIVNGNEAILAPYGAYVNNSDKTIKDANGNNIHYNDVYISDNYAFIINATNFPDANFRSQMLNLYPKGYLTQDEVLNLTYLDVSGKGISNMTGVEKLSYLQTLKCNGNSISSLNLNSNIFLTYVDCYSNNMTSLYVNSCTNLTHLDCGPNNLTSLNLSNLGRLQSLNCINNKLTSISFAPSLPNLESVMCYGNNFTTFSLYNCPSLKTLNIKNCTSLTTLNCYNNALTTLNVTGNTALTKLWCDGNANLASITGLADCTAMKDFACNGCSLTDLSTVNNFNKLETLACQYNKLTTLTITNKNYLTTLKCYNNPQLTTITVTGNTALKTLEAMYCTALTRMNCYSNALTSLVLTGNSALTYLRCYYNADLATITGLANCTAITYLDCEDCAITSLSVQNMNNIATLLARNNKLTSLSVNNKSQLATVYLSGNTSLTTLNCYNNALTSLDVSSCTALTTLSCYGNPNLSTITGLYDCTNIVSLDVASCNFSTLTVTNRIKMKTLYCNNNKLIQLNVAGCPQLTVIDCSRNMIADAGMNILVNSLSLRSTSNPGTLYAIYDTDEGNTMSADQIITAQNKFWQPKKTNGSNWVDLTAGMQGDVNSDGVVNITDVTVLINAVMNENFSGINSANADMNNDGIINITDVTMLINTVSNS